GIYRHRNQNERGALPQNSCGAGFPPLRNSHEMARRSVDASTLCSRFKFGCRSPPRNCRRSLARLARIHAQFERAGKILEMENGRPQPPTGPHAMKYDVRIGGKTRVVELTRNSEKWRISLDGSPLDVYAVEVTPN